MPHAPLPLTSPSGGLPKGEHRGRGRRGWRGNEWWRRPTCPHGSFQKRRLFLLALRKSWEAAGLCRDLKGRDGGGMGPPACTPSPSGIHWCRWDVKCSPLPPGTSAAPSSRSFRWGEVVGGVSVSLALSCAPSPALWATGPLITLGRRYRPGVSSCPSPLACSMLTVGSRHHLINLSGQT